MTPPSVNSREEKMAIAVYFLINREEQEKAMGIYGNVTRIYTPWLVVFGNNLTEVI